MPIWSTPRLSVWRWMAPDSAADAAAGTGGGAWICGQLGLVVAGAVTPTRAAVSCAAVDRGGGPDSGVGELAAGGAAAISSPSKRAIIRG